MPNFRFAVVLGVITLMPAVVRADLSTTDTFTYPSPLTGYTSESGSSFSQFNPALGTLNSITFNLTATATFSGEGANLDANNALYTWKFSGNGVTNLSADAVNFGNGSAPATLTNHTVTDSGTLDVFIGAGDITTAISVENLGTSANIISSAFSPESVTYNYTPAISAVPEPSAIVLLLTLFGVVALACRKRLRKMWTSMIGKVKGKQRFPSTIFPIVGSR